MKKYKIRGGLEPKLPLKPCDRQGCSCGGEYTLDADGESIRTIEGNDLVKWEDISTFVCTCGCESTYGIDCGLHSAWCDKLKEAS